VAKATKLHAKAAKPERKTAKRAKAAKPDLANLVIGPPDHAPNPGGRPTAYRPEFAKVAKGMSRLGATDFDIAEELGVTTVTIWNWRSKHQEFFNALLEGKEAFDDRIERSLAQRAAGYSYHSQKVMQFEGQTVRADIIEHIAPDVGAIKLWLGNRRPDKWKEKAEVNVTGAEAFVAVWKAISASAAA
jgi:hypothetical protein